MKVMHTQARNLKELNKRYKWEKYTFEGWTDKSRIKYGDVMIEGCFRFYRRKHRWGFNEWKYDVSGIYIIFFHDEGGREDFPYFE